MSTVNFHALLESFRTDMIATINNKFNEYSIILQNEIERSRFYEEDYSRHTKRRGEQKDYIETKSYRNNDRERSTRPVFG